jgi:hypothetical protein
VSDEPDADDELTPAERRVRTLLAENLGGGGAPEGEQLTQHVVRTARWQRPLRRVLVAFGGTAGALAAGAGHAFRAYRRR